MTSHRPQRDSHGRFTRIVLPPPAEELSQSTPTLHASSSRPSRLQRIIASTVTLLTSSVPMSEFVNNIATAFHYSSPDQEASTLQPASPVDPSSPTRFTPPCCYATKPCLPCPDFNAPGSDESQPNTALDTAFIEDSDENHHPPLQALDEEDDNDNLYFDDDHPLPEAPPPPQHQKPPPFTFTLRIPPLPPSHSRLSGPLPPLPSSSQPIAAMSLTSGPATMPSARSKTAPFFSGNIDNPIEDFLQEYEELADSYRLNSRQKVETVIQYVAQSQRDIWKSLEGYINHDWVDLCCDLCDEYIDPTLQGRYSKQKLQDYTNKRARHQIEDEEDVLKYYRIFNRLSKPLLDSDRITTGERNTAFWRRFHPDDRKALHERLIAKKPDMPRGHAFDYKDILSIARAIFSGDDDFYLQEAPSRRHESDRARERRTERHERDPRESDCDKYAPRQNWSREPPSFEGLESEDEDTLYLGEDDYKCPKQKSRHSSPRVETKTVRFKNLFRSEEDRELDKLIRHLHTLSVRDPEYASLYALSLRQFPDIVSTLPKPKY